MQQYQSVGLGGLGITPIHGVKGYEHAFIDFLSPQWMDMLEHTLQEAKKLGLGIDMANATGGPWVKPADACKRKLYTGNKKHISYRQGISIRYYDRRTGEDGK